MSLFRGKKGEGERSAVAKKSKELAERRRADFEFMVVCAAKGNMAMYELLRDRELVAA